MARFLARDRFEAARRFVADGARPLDRALLDLALGAGSAQTALAALAIYQNVDGGFGRGLEPDLSSPASSAIATSIGLRLLARLGAPSDHPMVQGAVRWLDANLDRTTGVWPIIGPGVELAPHAPWWTWSQDMAGSDSVAGAKNGFRFNPTAEILGLLYLYRGGVPAPLIDATETGQLGRRGAQQPDRRRGRGPDRRTTTGRRLDAFLGLELRGRPRLGEGQARLERLAHPRGAGDLDGSWPRRGCPGREGVELRIFRRRQHRPALKLRRPTCRALHAGGSSAHAVMSSP